jgi:hypothetical protein
MRKMAWPGLGMVRENHAMKKMLPTALAALALMGLPARPASAHTFGLFPHSCGCGSCGCNFCIRPYNAFSPVCCGTVYCDGCTPFGCGAPGCLPYSGFPGCGPGGCCDGGIVSQPMPTGASQMYPTGAVPAMPVAPVPQALPNPLPKGPPAASAGFGQPGIYPVSYSPGYYPAYGYGYGYVPQMPAYGAGNVPAYWNGQ